MNSSLRIILAFSLVTLSFFLFSSANAARSNVGINSGSMSGSSGGGSGGTTRMGELTQATMAARQKVMEAQNYMAECEKKAADLRSQLYVINNTIPQLQARMAEWSIVALPPPTTTSSMTNAETGTTVTTSIKPTGQALKATETKESTSEPEQTGDFLSNFMNFLKKYWFYGVGGLLVVIWLVSRSMR